MRKTYASMISWWWSWDPFQMHLESHQNSSHQEVANPFLSCYMPISEPPTKKNPKSLPNRSRHNFPWSQLPQYSNNNSVAFLIKFSFLWILNSFISVSIVEVFFVVSSLKDRRKLDPDKIENKVLKIISENLISHLCSVTIAIMRL